jgi:hypothetical protein
VREKLARMSRCLQGCKNIYLSIELKESKILLKLNFGFGPIFGVVHFKQPAPKILFFMPVVYKTSDTKNESLFLVSVKIIDQHHKKT